MTYKEILLRLFFAVFIGGLIGYEREYKQRPAGFRTHILVCVGAAIVSIIQVLIGDMSIEIINTNEALKEVFKVDYGRLGAQVITGIGFLGAGTIIHLKGSVKGLTTAATIWAVACIGLGVGFGFYFLSLSSTLIIFITLIIFKKLEGKFIYRKKALKLLIEFSDNCVGSKELSKLFIKHSIDILELTVFFEDTENKKSKFEYSINVPISLSNSELLTYIILIKEVSFFKIL